MTTLDLSLPSSPEGPLSPWARVKWSVVVPWLVSILLVSANGYHRFLSAESNRETDAAEIRQLRQQVSDIQRQVAVLVAITERLESQQNADILRQNRRGRE